MSQMSFSGRAVLALGMVSAVMLGLALGVLFISGRTNLAQGTAPTVKYIYSAKFVCSVGPVEEHVIDIPGIPGVQQSFFLAGFILGQESTTVNVHNFLDQDVSFTKKAVISNRQRQPLGPVSGKMPETLPPDQALKMECGDVFEAAPDVPNVVVGPPNVDFGSAFVGQQGGITVVGISNIGGADMVISSVRLQNGQHFTISPAFFIVNPLPVTIAAGKAIGIPVQFTPKAPGTLEDRLLIQTNDPNEPISAVVLRGVGVPVGPQTPALGQAQPTIVLPRPPLVPFPSVEGFIVIESPVELDVVAVYRSVILDKEIGDTEDAWLEDQTTESDICLNKVVYETVRGLPPETIPRPTVIRTIKELVHSCPPTGTPADLEQIIKQADPEAARPDSTINIFKKEENIEREDKIIFTLKSNAPAGTTRPELPLSPGKLGEIFISAPSVGQFQDLESAVRQALNEQLAKANKPPLPSDVDIVIIDVEFGVGKGVGLAGPGVGIGVGKGVGRGIGVGIGKGMGIGMGAGISIDVEYIQPKKVEQR